jgi:hypothetical protein
MSSKKIIIVFGALGNQGGSVIDSLLNDPDTAGKLEIHGVTRDPAKPAALALAERGVKVVKVSIIHINVHSHGNTLSQASLEDIESLRLIVNGAYAVFAVTNWNEIMDKEREIQQGKNIADVSKVKIICTTRFEKLFTFLGIQRSTSHLERHALRFQEYASHSVDIRCRLTQMLSFEQ